MKRTEKDALGALEVDAETYYGIFTERAKRNFQISGIKANSSFLKALAIIKKAAANANIKLGVLDSRIGKAIADAADEVIAGSYSEQFPLDVFQAGAGTPFNMNMNEVIANIAIEKLGGKKGQYSIVHPNNHVNMAQSSNDVIPTAIRIAVLLELRKLTSSLEALAQAFESKADEYSDTLKTGRTHLQDAVPMTYGQAFRSQAVSIKKCISRINNAKTEMQELGIGGTAIGTGITTHPKFKEAIVDELNKETNLSLMIAQDSIETTWSASSFLHFSSSLRTLAAELIKICDDLMLLSSGPKTGIAELMLPEAEPGSSIMPGKVNPSIPECMKMICMQAIGNDLAVMEGAKSGNLELNVNTPVIAHNLLWSMELLANGTKMLREFCVSGISVNKERTSYLLENSHVMATALNPYLGYEVVAEIVKIALKENKPVKKVITERQIVTEHELDIILDAKSTTIPQLIDQQLAEKIRGGEGFKKFRQEIGK